MIQIADLAAVLLQCFLVLLAGYVSGRMGFISPHESQGISKFVSHFALPALIFRSLATLDFSDICWPFVASILLAKVLVFIVVAAAVMLLTKPCNLSLSGLLAIFCTQSNDFAVGYPIITSLYSQTHPSFAKYLYVLAPIQLVLLNPVGLFMMEIQKQHDITFRPLRRTSMSSYTSTRSTSLTVPVIKGILLNPVIIMTFIGIAWNFIFSNTIPVLIDQTLEVLASAFSASALFLLGINMVGKFVLFKGSLNMILPVILVAVKSIILPVVIWFFVDYIFLAKIGRSLANFSFLYGTIPAAPTSLIFALQYSLPTDTISSATVLSTLLSAPVMFVCANIIRFAESKEPISPQKDLSQTVAYVSSISLPCIIITLIAFLATKKWRSITHRWTIGILFFQLVNSIAGFLWFFMDIENMNTDYRMKYTTYFVLSLFSVISTRIWTALLAITISLLYWRSLCYVLQWERLLLGVGILLSSATLVVSTVFYVPDSFSSNLSHMEPVFGLKTSQATVAIVALIPCLFITIAGIVVTQNFLSKKFSPLEHDSDDIPILIEVAEEVATPRSSFRAERPSISSRATGPAINHDEVQFDIEDMATNFNTFCHGHPSCNKKNHTCTQKTYEYRQNFPAANNAANDGTTLAPMHQIVSHIMLLMMLCLSMIIGIAVSFGKILLEQSIGVFLNLEYLDILLNQGQGVILFVVFGVDFSSKFAEFIKSLLRRYFQLTREEDISQFPPAVEQFKTCHLERACYDLSSDGQSSSNSDVLCFTGERLVDWLVSQGVCPNRDCSLVLAQQLIDAELLQGLTECTFYDSSLLYRFVQTERNNRSNSLMD